MKRRILWRTTTLWRGIEIEIRVDPKWLWPTPTAHLELQTLHPENARLPLTETGYRSHFIPYAEDDPPFDDINDAEAMVLAWLDKEAAKPDWREAEAKRAQLSLDL